MIDVMKEETDYKIHGGLKVKSIQEHGTSQLAPSVLVMVDGFDMELNPDDEDLFLIDFASLLERFKNRRLAYVQTKQDELRSSDPARAEKMDEFLKSLREAKSEK